MATLKHLGSKNADYGAAEQYLLFEHDEFTMKPVLDEKSIKRIWMYEILRQQLSRTNTERFPCFQTIQLTDTFQGNVELDMECNDLFF